eukprot:UN17706
MLFTNRLERFFNLPIVLNRRACHMIRLLRSSFANFESFQKLSIKNSTMAKLSIPNGNRQKFYTYYRVDMFKE